MLNQPINWVITLIHNLTWVCRIKSDSNSKCLHAWAWTDGHPPSPATGSMDLPASRTGSDLSLGLGVSTRNATLAAADDVEL